MARVLQGTPPSPQRRSNAPAWLQRACRCPECYALLVTTEGQWVTCLQPGHVGLMGRSVFEQRVLTARQRARTQMRVNLTERGMLRIAWELVRYGEPSPAAPPQQERDGREEPTATLFDLLPDDAPTHPDPHPVPRRCHADDAPPA